MKSCTGKVFIHTPQQRIKTLCSRYYVSNMKVKMAHQKRRSILTFKVIFKGMKNTYDQFHYNFLTKLFNIIKKQNKDLISYIPLCKQTYRNKLT